MFDAARLISCGNTKAASKDMTQMTTESPEAHISTSLSTATERLYEVFAKYEVLGMVEGCPCCVSDEDKARLHSKPLRQLAPDDVSRYAWKAMTTWGEVSDFKYFLPRLLEQIATHSGWNTGVETVLHKVQYAEFSDWPSVEQEALRDFLWEWWRSLLHPVLVVVKFWDGDEPICTIAGVVENIQPFLDEWASSRSTSSVRALAAFIQTNANELMKTRRFRDSDWHERPRQMEQAIGWVIQPARKDALENAFFERMNGPFAEEFSWAVQQLEGVLHAFSLE